MAVKACGPKNINYSRFWNTIKRYQENENTIKVNDTKRIFKKEWSSYEKIFGVDSNLFRINIVKDDKMLTAFVRRYKDRERYIKLLKVSVTEYNLEEEIVEEDE